jgi:hypothetical protein
VELPPFAQDFFGSDNGGNWTAKAAKEAASCLSAREIPRKLGSYKPRKDGKVPLAVAPVRD